jgi:3,4-dihydroxy-2-butanone 4-phosphate synthase
MGTVTSTISAPAQPGTCSRQMPLGSFASRSHQLRSVLGELRAGNAVVIVDDIGGTGCDLVTAAAGATAGTLHRLVLWGSGFVCVTVDQDTCIRLDLPPMYWHGQSNDYAGPMCVTVDAVAGTTTGISARDRATTARRLADPTSGPADFSRPGHVVPVRAEAFSGDRPTRASAASALVDLAGVGPSAVFCGLVSTHRPTEMATSDDILSDPDSVPVPVISYSELLSTFPAENTSTNGAN